MSYKQGLQALLDACKDGRMGKGARVRQLIDGGVGTMATVKSVPPGDRPCHCEVLRDGGSKSTRWYFWTRFHYLELVVAAPSQQAVVAQQGHECERAVQAITAQKDSEREHAVQAITAQKDSERERVVRAVTAQKDSERESVVQAITAQKDGERALAVRAISAKKDSERELAVQAVTAQKDSERESAVQAIAAQKDGERERAVQAITAQKDSELQHVTENHSQEIENPSQGRAKWQRTAEVSQEKMELHQENRRLQELLQIQPVMEQLKIDKARLEERCEQRNIVIQSKEQEVKSLRGELDDVRRHHDQEVVLSSICEDKTLSSDLLQRIAQNGTSHSLSGTDASWIQVGGNGATVRSSDDAYSCVSIDTTHCWMANALFKKDTNGAESYVPARSLLEGSLVRAANGKIIKVAEPPRQHETDIVIWLHAASATLPLTPNHRVPICGDSDKAEKLAKDLQEGDLIFVDGVPTELTMKEEMSGKWDVVQIRFVPDELVPVFMAPPAIDTKGCKKKPLRRGIKKKSPNEASGSAEVKTEGYYMD